MTFVHPILAIAGAACVAVPIIIHLLMRRRRKPVPWAAMRFLLEAFRQQKRRLRLEQLLLLAARCLLVLLVGMAIARPMLGAAGILSGRGPMTMYLLVDNGLASSAESEAAGAAGAVMALDRHKALAADLLGQLDPGMGDRAGLIALGGPSEGLVVPASSNIAAVGEVVKGLAATDSGTDSEGAFATLRAQFDREAAAAGAEGGRTVVVLLSDHLRGSTDTERPLPALAPAGMADRVTLVSTAPAREGAGNITVAGVEPLRAVAIVGAGRGSAEASQAQVRVTLRRTGPATGEAATTTVRVEAEPVSLRAGRVEAGRGAGARPAGRAVVRWSAGQTEASASVAAPMPPGSDLEGSALVLTARIDSDAISGDNVLRRPVEVRSAIRVGLAAPHRPGGAASVQQFEPGDWFRLALQPDADDRGRAGGARGGEFEFSEVDPGAIDAARLAGLDAVFLPRPDAVPDVSWRRLRAFADGGGLLIVCPPPGTAVNLWPDAMARELGMDWSPAREAKAWDAGLTISPERPAAAAGEDLLALIGAELSELVRGVHFWRTLPVEFGPARGGAAPAARVLLEASDGSALIVAGAPGRAGEAGEAGAAQGSQSRPVAPGAGTRGLVVYIATAFSFDWTDVQARPLMVPLVQELVRQGVGRAHAPWSAVAGTRPEAPARTVEIRAVGEESVPAIAVGADGFAAAPVRMGGVWRALDERGTPRAVVAVNADPRAGDGQQQTPAAVEAWLLPAAGSADGLRWIDGGSEAAADTSTARDLKRTIDAEQGRDRFTLPLLLGAIGVALVELCLARWFSHASVARGTSTAKAGVRWRGEAAA